MNQSFRDKPKSTTPSQSHYQAPRSPAPHEIGGVGNYEPKVTTNPSTAMTGDLNSHSDTPGMIRARNGMC